MSKREKATRFILDSIAGIIPGDKTNVELMKMRLEAMSDQEFHDLMLSMRPDAEKQNILPFFAPNLQENKIQLESLEALAQKLKTTFYHHLHLTDPESGVTFQTPHKYLVMDLPVRRQAQMRYKKDSIPEHIRTVDDLSGQPVGDSKGAKISYPELQAQSAQDLTNTILEEIKIRGGDQKAFEEFERQILETGTASLESILQMNTTVRSTEILSILLKSAHLNNNLSE